MSCATLIASDKKLPLLIVDLPCTIHRELVMDGRLYRGDTVCTSCFAVQENTYYKGAVDRLGFAMKPYQYEIDWYPTPESLSELRKYLSENFAPGETVEIWSVWVGDRPEGETHQTVKFQDLDLNVLAAFEDNPVGQNCVVVEM